MDAIVDAELNTRRPSKAEAEEAASEAEASSVEAEDEY